MKFTTTLILFLLLTMSVNSVTKKRKPKKTTTDRFQNQLIDYTEFQNIVNTSAEDREIHRLTEEEFLKMMAEPDIIILDARSEARYLLRHIDGAKNLPFTEFTEQSLMNVIPKKESKILIYCNNNFSGSPESFAAKAPAASLNLSTFTSLKAYGYKNIYELGPLLDIGNTKIPFKGKETESNDSKLNKTEQD
jgi:hypothetical protein